MLPDSNAVGSGSAVKVALCRVDRVLLPRALICSSGLSMAFSD